MPTESWSLPGPAPVGVVRLCSAKDQAATPVYRGPAYCQAVRRAGAGEILRVLPDSIQVCKWAPPVLGLKRSSSRFEKSLSPQLPWPNHGLLLGRLDLLPARAEVVILRSTPEVISALLKRAGADCLHLPAGPGRAESALGAGERLDPTRGLLGAVNRSLASLSASAGFQSLTRQIFRSELLSAGFEALISRTLADMSVCRNSTVVPLLTGKVNVSFFCTGGITWGGNEPDQITSGWPLDVFERVMRDRNGA